jgi:Tol biopolymer transport system component/DNA-binding SARP family transcriptional activator
MGTEVRVAAVLQLFVGRLLPVSRAVLAKKVARGIIFPMIQLCLLGEIRLVSSDGAAIEAVLRQPKRLALLAYLAAPAPGTWHRRDMLLALFWPELDTAHARTSLRNALYVLRQHLGDGVLRTRGDEEISIDPAALRTDLDEVWSALRDGRPEDALARYGGELLPGLHPPDSDGFVRWLDSERTRLRTAVASAAVARAEALERDGRVASALAIVRRVAEVQPDDETVVRRLMLLHEAVGDRAGALAAFEAYRTRLAADFDAEPAAATIELAARLRAAVSPPPAVTPGPERPTEPAARAGVPPISPSGVPPAAPPAPAAPARPIARQRALILGGTAVVLLIGGVVAGRTALLSPRGLSIGSTTPLTSDEGLQVEAAISPNGRLVAYAKGTPSALHVVVQTIAGRRAWRLTDDSSTAELMPRWAPDNDQLLYLSRSSAYVAPAIGGAPRLVARGTPGDGMVRSASWSPSGDSIVIVRNDSLMVQPLVGSGSRYVGSGRQLHACVWSPTGEWIACVTGNWVAFEPGPLFGNRAPSGIVLYPAAGGAPIDVTGSEFQHESPSWAPDGASLWMVTDRSGTPNDVQSVAIGRNGRPAGPFVRMGLTAESIDLTRNRMAYSVPVRRANIWSVPVPGESLLTLTAAARVTSGTQLVEVVSASPDGRWLLYDSNVDGNANIFRIPAGGGTPERLTDDPAPEYAAAMSPDGQEIAWQRFVRGERRVFVRRLDEDTARQVLAEPGDYGVPHFSPDGRALAIWSHDREAGSILIVRRDARGNWMRPAWRLEGGQLPRWSPDGRRLAFVRYDGGIETIPADSGARHTVYRRRPQSADPIASNVVWDPDGRTIWFVGSDPRGNGGIWSVPAGGGVPRLRVRFADDASRAHGPSLTSDGARFYFTLDERFSNIRWAELVAGR